MMMRAEHREWRKNKVVRKVIQRFKVSRQLTSKIPNMLAIGLNEQKLSVFWLGNDGNYGQRMGARVE